jgi:hypothetical protein
MAKVTHAAPLEVRGVGKRGWGAGVCRCFQGVVCGRGEFVGGGGGHSSKLYKAVTRAQHQLMTKVTHAAPLEVRGGAQGGEGQVYVVADF